MKRRRVRGISGSHLTNRNSMSIFLERLWDDERDEIVRGRELSDSAVNKSVFGSKGEMLGPREGFE